MKKFILTLFFIMMVLNKSFLAMGIKENVDIMRAEKDLKNSDLRKSSPRLETIGEINGKFYYYDAVAMNKNEAEAFCEEFGLELAYFDSKADSTFVIDRTPDQHYWTNAERMLSLTGFRWGYNDGPIFSSIGFAYFESSLVGFALDANDGSDSTGYLRQQLLSYTSYCPLCLRRSNNFSLDLLQEAAKKSISNDQNAPFINRIVENQKVDQLINKIRIPTQSSQVNVDPRMEYIGIINGKSYYLGNTTMTRSSSRIHCREYEMELAHFDTMDEVNYVWNRIPAGYFWTDGEQIISSSYFRWGHNNGTITDHLAVYGSNTFQGLTFDGNDGQFKGYLVQTNVLSAYRPLCVAI